jgi:flavin reductase (DIM6/NTAB) family NADH-FMN oxidoreductase RutF
MAKHITPFDFNEKVFKLIGKEWMLITAGDRHKCNTMTASYGNLGILFGKPVASIYVRPERYTYEFLEKQDKFSLSFFTEDYRQKLQYCGKASGKNEDKIANCGFTTLYTQENTPYFKEARLTLICRKIYVQDLDKALLLDEKAKQAVYGTGGIHRMYVGEIVDIIYQD